VLELINESAWAAGLYPGWDAQRCFQMTLVVKAGYRFELDGALSPLPDLELIEADSHYGKPLETSLEFASEIAPFKQGSEIYLRGTAYPPKAGAVVAEVSMALHFADRGRWQKRLRVFGVREWKRRVVGRVPTSPMPLEPVPLRYEYAFGGRHEDSGDEYDANPVGMGFNRGQWRVDDERLPQIELGPPYLTSPSQRRPPGGFGPLPVFWSPRVEAMGEAGQDGAADEADSSEDTCPYARDMRADAYNAAPSDQRFDQPFAGGEVLQLRGFFTDQAQGVELVLPADRPTPLLHAGTEQRLEPVFDTVIVDTDAREIHVLYRVGIPWQFRTSRRGYVIVPAMEDLSSGRDNDTSTLSQAGVSR